MRWKAWGNTAERAGGRGLVRDRRPGAGVWRGLGAMDRGRRTKSRRVRRRAVAREDIECAREERSHGGGAPAKLSGGPRARSEGLEGAPVARRAAHSFADKRRTRRSAGSWQCVQGNGFGRRALSLTGAALREASRSWCCRAGWMMDSRSTCLMWKATGPAAPGVLRWEGVRGNPIKDSDRYRAGAR